MKWVAVIVGVISGLFWIDALASDGGQPCKDCHIEIFSAYERSIMSRAASTPIFLAEWNRSGKNDDCFECHAPSGGQGVQCRDCHAGNGHPYSAINVPEICAKCHDAPGEVTVRTFFQSQAFRDGGDCLQCHVSDQTDNFHEIVGPSRSGFLKGVAQLRLSVASRAKGKVAIVRISHKAGHALPGGTTGRAVWLVVEGIGATENLVWRDLFRFGWEHTQNGVWTDKTLPPNRVAIIEIDDPYREGVRKLKASLVYQFAAGEFDGSEVSHVQMDGVQLLLKRQ